MAAELEALTVSVGLPDPLTAVELRFAETPTGAPVISSCTMPEKLPCEPMLAVTVVFPPLATVAELGLMLTEKSAGGACTALFPLLNPAQAVRHNTRNAAAIPDTNLGEIIGPRLRAKAKIQILKLQTSASSELSHALGGMETYQRCRRGHAKGRRLLSYGGFSTLHFRVSERAQKVDGLSVGAELRFLDCGID